MQEEKMIDYGSRNNKKRIEQTEKELEALLQRAQKPQEEEEEVQEEPKQEAEPESAEEKNWKKRYGDLRRHSQSLEDKIKELQIQMDKTAPDLPSSEEDLDQWRKDHPKVYARVEAIAQKIAEAKLAQQEEKFKRLEEREKEAVRKEAEAKIREEHPDFLSIKKSDEFHAWAEQQPKWIQDALYDNEDDAQAVIKILNLYKLENDIQTKRVRKDKGALESVKGGRTAPDAEASSKGRTFKESEIAKMSLKEFEKNLEAINEAKREGRIIYDMRR